MPEMLVGMEQPLSHRSTWDRACHSGITKPRPFAPAPPLQRSQPMSARTAGGACVARGAAAGSGSPLSGPSRRAAPGAGAGRQQARPSVRPGGRSSALISFAPGRCELVEEDVDIPSRRVLITGATGLLGRAVFKEFRENNWNAVGCGYRRAQPRFEQINLLDSIAVHDIIHDFQPHVIVHCAAERRPDVVESQPDAASQLNVAASANLAKEAAGVGAFLIYISTDYVFDGTSPPYKETDVPNPLNLYGKTKLEGEKAVLENNEGAAVLRIPVLYGEVERLEESAVTVMFDKVQFSNKSANMDHWQQRFPTNVKDVAAVCRQLAEKRMMDPSVKGTFHWSGNEQMTKYEMACAIADAFNLPSSHLRPITDSPVVGALRPRNAQLDCSKLEMLGIGQRTPFRAGIKESLWPFLIDKRWRQTVFH
ncbi:methionine adenosyltransferase 2 subunit beta [Manacus vitellinus]|nr:methionine adenosyltransferase 2 subunit beta [Manacus vitellinus]